MGKRKIKVTKTKSDIGTINTTLDRLRADGLAVNENALRNWIRNGHIPSVASGRAHFVYYPDVVKFLTGKEPG